MRKNKYEYMLDEEAGFLTRLLTDLATGPDSAIPFISDIARRIMGTSNSSGFKMGRNLAKEAAGLTAVFPVLVTDAVAIDQAVMVSKAVERKFVAMFQMLFAANEITNATTAKEFLGKFHKNLTNSIDLSSMNVDDIIELSNRGDLFEAVGDEELYPYAEKALYAVLEDIRENPDYKIMANEDINETSINDFFVKQVFDEAVVRKRPGTATKGSHSYELKTPLGGISRRYDYDNATDMTPDEIKNQVEALNKQVMASDIKKANEATPSLIVVNFKNTTAIGEVINSSAVIGVKAIIHYVPSTEMISRLALKNTDRKGLINFIRATTGEIKFFRDFLFAIDRAKVDAVARSGRGSNSRIWKMLELRAHQAKLNLKSGRNNANCAAITTIVLSDAEAAIIKKQYRIDIKSKGTLLGIMRGYNFIAAAIVDEVDEKVSFLWDDGTNDFETLSFMSLEREEGGGMYKKVINMMTKGR